MLSSKPSILCPPLFPEKRTTLSPSTSSINPNPIPPLLFHYKKTLTLISNLLKPLPIILSSGDDSTVDEFLSRVHIGTSPEFVSSSISSSLSPPSTTQIPSQIIISSLFLTSLCPGQVRPVCGDWSGSHAIDLPHARTPPPSLSTSSSLIALLAMVSREPRSSIAFSNSSRWEIVSGLDSSDRLQLQPLPVLLTDQLRDEASPMLSSYSKVWPLSFVPLLSLSKNQSQNIERWVVT
ncbi:ramosa 1 enhancer locus 2 [Iris pallida]|uniref:Ramosa 1 enhancer locus 2 n=1 Tax=Iris pallida TaxID=29817 RepID=A0AAX6GDY1_IRIPA|nr:ramosa 1 enhancer locus 2 [Iris pallida]